MADAAEGGERVTLHFFRNPATAPAFTVRDLDGRELSSASWRGKVVILNFWATWCPPCRAEIPDLVALQDKYRDRLVVIGIYPIVMMTPELEKMFPGVSALPTSFILDRESRIVQKHVGMLTAQRTEYETRALAGLPVNASIEEVDQTQGLKLDSSAQLMTIPGSQAHRSTSEAEVGVLHLRVRPHGREMPGRRSRLRRQPPARPRDRQADRRHTVSAESVD